MIQNDEHKVDQRSEVWKNIC